MLKPLIIFCISHRISDPSRFLKYLVYLRLEFDLGFGFQLFFSYFKDLVGREVTVELKNDLAIRGTLHSVDQYLNIKLENTRVVDQDKYPHMVSHFFTCIIFK